MARLFASGQLADPRRTHPASPGRRSGQNRRIWRKGASLPARDTGTGFGSPGSPCLPFSRTFRRPSAVSASGRGSGGSGRHARRRHRRQRDGLQPRQRVAASPVAVRRRSDRVVILHSTHRQQPEDWADSGLSYPDYTDMREQSSRSRASAAFLNRNFTVSTETDADRLLGVSVTPELFSMLGVEPMLGRTFTPTRRRRPGSSRRDPFARAVAAAVRR